MNDSLSLLLPPSFWRNVQTTSDGCWTWTGALNAYGYGQWGGRARLSGLAHRHLVLALRGPTDLSVDHACHNRARQSCPGGRDCPHRRCVNPAHLELRPIGRNVLGGNGPSAEHARQESCVNGHAFTPENTGTRSTPTGTARVCRACKRIRERARRARLAA